MFINLNLYIIILIFFLLYYIYINFVIINILQIKVTVNVPRGTIFTLINKILD